MLGGSEAALSVVQVVSLVAAEAGSGIVEGIALIRNGNADLVGVEDPVGRALLADLLVPVPSSTSDIRNSLSGSEDALSVVEIVALVAGKTSASAVKGVALVGDRNTDIFAIEDPVVGALDTGLLVPVPGGATDV